MICDFCGRANAAARFCDACGAALRPKPGGQETRKIVTVVLTDVVGSAALGERLEPRRCTDRGEGREPPLTAWRVFGVWPDAWPLSDHRQRGAAGRACGPTGTP